MSSFACTDVSEALAFVHILDSSGDSAFPVQRHALLGEMSKGRVNKVVGEGGVPAGAGEGEKFCACLQSLRNR